VPGGGAGSGGGGGGGGGGGEGSGRGGDHMEESVAIKSHIGGKVGYAKETEKNG